MSLSWSSARLRAYVTDVFIETGTQDGGCVFMALEAGFREVHTIEIDPSYHEYAKSRHINHPNVHLYLGDSALILPKIVAELDPSKRATFWLDAHSETYNPLLLELDSIANHPRKDHIIMIDDRREWGRGTCWGGISEQLLQTKCREINPDYRFVFVDSYNAKKDIMVAIV